MICCHKMWISIRRDWNLKVQNEVSTCTIVCCWGVRLNRIFMWGPSDRQFWLLEGGQYYLMKLKERSNTFIFMIEVLHISSSLTILTNDTVPKCVLEKSLVKLNYFFFFSFSSFLSLGILVTCPILTSIKLILHHWVREKCFRFVRKRNSAFLTSHRKLKFFLPIKINLFFLDI